MVILNAFFGRGCGSLTEHGITSKCLRSLLQRKPYYMSEAKKMGILFAGYIIFRDMGSGKGDEMLRKIFFAGYT